MGSISVTDLPEIDEMIRIRLRCSGLSDPISSDPWFVKDHNNINY